MAPLPEGVERVEVRLLGKMLHAPGNTFGVRWQVDLPSIGGTAFGSVRGHAAGVALRAAVSTFRRFDEVIGMVRRAHADVATLAELAHHLRGHLHLRPAPIRVRMLGAGYCDPTGASRWAAHGPVSLTTSIADH